LTAEEYAALMSDNVEDVIELRLWSLEKIKENKAKVARAYNKKVKPKEFQVGDLVWEAVLAFGTKDATYGKWSPNWHGPLLSVKTHRRATTGNMRSREASGTAGGPWSLGQRPSDPAHTLAWSR
jgi:hypothetical protein